MNLKSLLKKINYEIISGNLDYIIEDISYNSKNVFDKVCFVCLLGIDHDGHDYIDEVIKKGCKSIIVSKNIKPIPNINIIKVNDTRKILPILSSNLFNNPGEKLIKIGITGTKGKTTSSFMLKKILESNNKTVGIIGTNGTFYLDKKIEHKNTTPESYLIQKYMRLMVDNNIKYLIMEVSSQALKVGRVSNIIFDYAIFTNISFDHVGKREHPTYDDYIYSKSLLFKQSKIGILNKDDNEYNKIISNTNIRLITYGKSNSDYLISEIRTKEIIGMNFKLNGEEYYVNMPGEFSVYNASSVIILSKLLNIPDNIIEKSLKTISVEGRSEVIDINGKYKVIIDYAHNNDSIKSIINSVKKSNNKVITIIGCGGGRDKNIRIGIGSTVGELSNYTIITSDNPRYDNIDEINNDIKTGVDKVSGKCIIINDRESAIKYAMTEIKEKDIILLLGKGHEKFQEINGVIIPFDERKIIESIKNNEKFR